MTSFGTLLPNEIRSLLSIQSSHQAVDTSNLSTLARLNHLYIQNIILIYIQLAPFLFKKVIVKFYCDVTFIIMCTQIMCTPMLATEEDAVWSKITKKKETHF